MKITRLFLLVFLLAGVLCSSSCSLLVRSGGKYEDEIFHKGATSTTVQQQLGRPIATKAYDPPTALKNISELKPYKIEMQKHGDIVVGSRQDFRYRGWIRDSFERGGEWGHGMALGSTAGLSEVYFFPASIVQRSKDSSTTHNFQVWFAPNGQYVFHRHLNRDPKTERTQ
ncbi:MAG: hypothetical protein ACPG4K_00010 [Haloferula sp.]